MSRNAGYHSGKIASLSVTRERHWEQEMLRWSIHSFFAYLELLLPVTNYFYHYNKLNQLYARFELQHYNHNGIPPDQNPVE